MPKDYNSNLANAKNSTPNEIKSQGLANAKSEYRTIYKNEKYFKDGKSTSDLMEIIKNDELYI